MDFKMVNNQPSKKKRGKVDINNMTPAGRSPKGGKGKRKPNLKGAAEWPGGKAPGGKGDWVKTPAKKGKPKRKRPTPYRR